MEAKLYDDAIWAEAAEALGLSLVDDELIPRRLATVFVPMRGEIDGRRVTVVHGVASAINVTVTVLLEHPLLLGMSLKRHQLGLIGVRALDQARGDALTARETDLGQALRALGTDTTLELTDSSVTSVRWGLADGAHFYVTAVRRVVDVARLAETARRKQERAHWEADLIQAFVRLSEIERLRFNEHQMRVEGTNGHHPISIWLAADSAFRVRAKLVLASPLGINLSVEPAGAIARALPFTQSDLRTGDAAFDRAFLVRARSAGDTQSRLSRAVREILIELDRRGYVTLNDDAVSFETKDLTTDLGRLFDDLGALAGALEVRAPDSPYR